jgi:hypothetical protein
MIAFKWGRPPKPAALLKLLPALRESAMQSLQTHAPTVTDWIVGRLRSRGVFARQGLEQPLPEYSDSYARALRRSGQPATPDLTLSGGLLDHLSGRARVRDAETVELIISPYGRANETPGDLIRTPGASPSGEVRPGWLWRAAYSYTVFRTGKVVTVAGAWIVDRRPAEAQARSQFYTAAGQRGRRKALYNAHLATYLAMRLGLGRWQRGGTPPSSFLTLTHRELEQIGRLLQQDRQAVAAALLHQVAGF